MIRLPATPLKEVAVVSDDRNQLYSASDLIAPTTIVHGVDELLDPDNPYAGHYYNYIDYIFEVDGGSIRARTYLDRIKQVRIYLPNGMAFQHPGALRVLQYLARRYGEIREGGDTRVEVEQTFVKPANKVKE